MQPRTRLVYFYFLRVELLLKTWSQGRRHIMRLPWRRYICRSKYGCFCLSPKVNYLHTKIEEGLKFFISNFASLSWRIALKYCIYIYTVLVTVTHILKANISFKNSVTQSTSRYTSHTDTTFIFNLASPSFNMCCFLLAEERKKQKTYFLHTSRSLGNSVAGGLVTWFFVVYQFSCCCSPCLTHVFCSCVFLVFYSHFISNSQSCHGKGKITSITVRRLELYNTFLQLSIHFLQN